MFLQIIILIPIFQILRTEELKFVFEIHRHGARAPFVGIKNNIDCYGEKWISSNELTEVGKRSHFLIGVRNRKRFIEKYNFLKKNFDPEEIEIFTTDFNRTIQSVYSQLMGLYPENTGKKISKNLINSDLIRPKSKNYSQFYINKEKEYFSNESKYYSLPFNINVFPLQFFYFPDHKIQLQSRSNCPNLDNIRKEVENREDMQNFIKKLTKKYGKELMILENTTNSSFLFNYKTTHKYMDSFIADLTDGRNLSLIKNLIGEKNMEDFKNLCYEFLFLDWNGTNFYNKKTAQVSMSYTFKTILNKMNDAIFNKSKVKFLIFSLHDNTIAGFEVFNQMAFNTSLQYTHFSENIYFELYMENKKYFVRLISKDEIRLVISYDEFKEKVEKLLLSDEEIREFCGWDKDKIENYTNFYLLMFYIINTLLFLLFISNYIRFKI